MSMILENQKVTLLVLPGLGAAFDTVDHRILLDRLKFDFGISGSVLNWIESYLSNRTQGIYMTEFYRIILILNLEFHKAAVSGHYCFLSMLANFLRSSNHIFLIPIVMQMTRNCISRLDQEMIWRRPLL